MSDQQGHQPRRGSSPLDQLYQGWQQQLERVNPAVPELIILLAPSGSGKTTRIEQMRAQGRALHHINRDGITADLLAAAGLDPRQMRRTPEQREQVNTILREQQLPAYHAALKDALVTAPAAAILVDYPPGRDNAWLEATVDAARQAGRQVAVEGLLVDPEAGLARVLRRNTRGLPRAAVEAQLGDSDHLKMTLATYQAFPGQFLFMTTLADRAQLLDNRGGMAGDRPVIAGWQNGQRMVNDATAYNAFQDLAGIDLSRVRYRGQIVQEELHQGQPTYQFRLDTFGTFRPNKKSGVGQSPTPD